MSALEDKKSSPLSVAPTDGQPSNAGADSPGGSDLNELDFRGDKEGDGELQVGPPHIGPPYDPRPQEDGARRAIAYLLIGLLWVVVGAIFILVAFGSINVADIKEFAVILGPVVTLVSAATGFYYGTKSGQSTGG